MALVDTDEAKVAALRGGRIPIYEPGLDRLVADNARDGRLSFTTDIAQAVRGADAVFLAVGTPSRRGDGHADLTYLFAAADEIARGLVEDSVVETFVTEYRLKPDPEGDGSSPLIGVSLCDRLSDGISMVYSFYDPDMDEGCAFE